MQSLHAMSQSNAHGFAMLMSAAGADAQVKDCLFFPPSLFHSSCIFWTFVCVTVTSTSSVIIVNVPRRSLILSSWLRLPLLHLNSSKNSFGPALPGVSSSSVLSVKATDVRWSLQCSHYLTHTAMSFTDDFTSKRLLLHLFYVIIDRFCHQLRLQQQPRQLEALLTKSP